MRYQTEIHVARDRYVCLQLPAYVPEGRAVVIVIVDDRDPSVDEASALDEADRHDIEWWDEFEGDEDRA